MISQSSIHAINAFVELSKNKRGVFQGATAIAKKINAPANYLGKLLQMFSRTGLLVSQKGKGGGVRLAKNPGNISIYRIVEPIDHVSRFKNCILGKKKCVDKEGCLLHNEWGSIRDRYINLLKNTKISDFVK